MKIREFRVLEDHEMAIVQDKDSGEFLAVAEHNQSGGTCSCCGNDVVYDGELIIVRNGVTGEIIWEQEEGLRDKGEEEKEQSNEERISHLMKQNDECKMRLTTLESKVRKMIWGVKV